MKIEEFKKEILGNKVSQYSEQEIEKLFRISIGFSNSMIHCFYKEKNAEPVIEQLVP